MTEAEMFSDWASRMDQSYAPFNTHEDFKAAQEAPVYMFDADTVSNLHKDAHGYRPSSYFWQNWEDASDDQKQMIWEDLCEDLSRNVALLAREAEHALQTFEDMIDDNIELGASDRETAIRWIVESLDLGGYATAEYACYHLGLSYSRANMFDGILPMERV